MPKHRVTSKGDRQVARRQLATWWAEWELDCALGGAAGDAAESAAPRRTSGTRERYSVAAPQVGEIRLLRPAAACWGPVYVLLLQGAEDRELYWVPFSRFHTPAWEEEWRTGLRAAALRVCCGWNARCPHPAHPPASWLVRRLTGATLERQHALFAAVRGRGPLGPFRRCCGPPLCHPADPRYTYRDEETARVDAHWPDAIRPQLEESTSAYLGRIGAEGVGWQAAETAGGYARPLAIYRTADGAYTVIVYQAVAGENRLRVITRTGLPATALDGGVVGGYGGGRSTPIKGGVTKFVGGDTLRLSVVHDAHGRAWALESC